MLPVSSILLQENRFKPALRLRAFFCPSQASLFKTSLVRILKNSDRTLKLCFTFTFIGDFGYDSLESIRLSCSR